MKILKLKKNKVPKTMNSMTDSFNIRLDDWKKNSSGLEECSEENTQNEVQSISQFPWF